MHKDTFEIDKPVVDRIINKITEQDLPIETEIGIVRQGMVKVLFIHNDYELLNRLMSESINEEYDLCPL